MSVREDAKKIYSLMSKPLWPYPPPSSLMAIRTCFSKRFKNYYFFLYPIIGQAISGGVMCDVVKSLIFLLLRRNNIKL